MVTGLKVGFVGTSYGMTKQQRASVLKLLTILDGSHSMESFHQCDYFGADGQVNSLIKSLSRIRVVTYPPKDLALRASLKSDVTMPVFIQPQLLVADHSDVLIATPETSVEVLHSTTWWAVRQAKGRDKYRYVFDLNGRLIEEHSKVYEDVNLGMLQ